jgi:hypothetical protein
VRKVIGLSIQKALGIIILGSSLLFTGGCNNDAPVEPGTRRGKMMLGAMTPRKTDLIERAAKALEVPGVPDAPLSATSTRDQRAAYLVATEEAYSSLLKLSHAPGSPGVAAPQLVETIDTNKVLLVSRMLAVNLADAIDRSDQARAELSVKTAIAYADTLAGSSISEWLVSGTVADSLAQGIKSVGAQLDQPMATRLRATIDELQSAGPSEEAVIDDSIDRFHSWQRKLAKSFEAVPVSQLILCAGGDPTGRATLSPSLEKDLSAVAPDGKVPYQVMVSEAKLVVDTAVGRLRKEDAQEPIDSKHHPVAGLYWSLIRPSIEAAPDLAEIRRENLRMLSLTLRVLVAKVPDDLAAFGEDAVSPVSGMKFVYKKSNEGFELVRPRQAGKRA